MKIEHVAVWVRDLELMKDFYLNYFDADANALYTNPKKQFQSYFLSFKSGARLELMTRPDILSHMIESGQEPYGYAHLAFALGSKEKVDALTETLRSKGYQVLGEPRTTGDGYYESVISDPEGNRIELTI